MRGVYVRLYAFDRVSVGVDPNGDAFRTVHIIMVGDGGIIEAEEWRGGERARWGGEDLGGGSVISISGADEISDLLHASNVYMVDERNRV